MHPLGRDKPGRKMTSPSSVADQWSISAHSRSIHQPKKKKKLFSLSQHGVWVARLGSFITSQSFYVDVDKWQKGCWGFAGWNGWHVFSIFTVIPQKGLPPGPACPIQYLAVCQIFDKFLKYFLSFACSDIWLNTGLLLHIHRLLCSDGSDSGR